MLFKSLVSLFFFVILIEAYAARLKIKEVEVTKEVDHHINFEMEIDKHSSTDGQLLSIIASVDISARTQLSHENTNSQTGQSGVLSIQESSRNYSAEIKLQESGEPWLIGVANGYWLRSRPGLKDHGYDGITDYRGESGARSINVVGQKVRDWNRDTIENDPEILQEFVFQSGEASKKTLYVFNPTTAFGSLGSSNISSANHHSITVKVTIKYIYAANSTTIASPPAPTNLSATNNLLGRVELSWTHSPETREILIYKAHAITACDPNMLISVWRADEGNTYMDNNMMSTSPKNYSLRARDKNGKLSECSSIVEGAVAGGVPAGTPFFIGRTQQVNLSYNSQLNRIDINWMPVDGAESYQVLKSYNDSPLVNPAAGPYIFMHRNSGESNTSSFDDDVVLGRNHCYRIISETIYTKKLFLDLYDNVGWEHACIKP